MSVIFVVQIKVLLSLCDRRYDVYLYFGNLRSSTCTDLAKSSLLGTDGWFKQVSLSFLVYCVETSRGSQKSCLKQVVFSAFVISKIYFCRKTKCVLIDNISQFEAFHIAQSYNILNLLYYQTFRGDATIWV